MDYISVMLNHGQSHEPSQDGVAIPPGRREPARRIERTTPQPDIGRRRRPAPPQWIGRTPEVQQAWCLTGRGGYTLVGVTRPTDHFDVLPSDMMASERQYPEVHGQRGAEARQAGAG